MAERVNTVEQGGLARSVRGPRRATPAAFRPRWDYAVLVDRKVSNLGNGKYRVTTIHEVSAEELVELGIEPPPQELPWQDEAPRPVSAAERASGLQYWSKVLGGYDPRLPSRMTVFIQEFGLEALLGAMDQVAAIDPKGGVGAKYAQFIRVLREMRSRSAR